MSFQIQLTSTARRNLNQLPPKVYAAVVEFLAGPLAANPHRVGKPLRAGLHGQWTARRGTYRIRYLIDDDRIVVVVVRIAHRADVYR